MTIPDFTIVLAVDARHLRQLSWTLPTWRRHKPSLFDRPMLVIYDWTQLHPSEVRSVVGYRDSKLHAWPPDGFSIPSGTDKWSNPQRAKMLASFVHVPPAYVETPYWLKIDTDVVATGMDDWIDPAWFEGSPVIVSHPWKYTKPPDQMVKLDEWVEKTGLFRGTKSLNIVPKPGAELVCHPRIISFVGFFRTDFTGIASEAARMMVGNCRLPVPSQDGYLWYLAARTGQGIVRTRMKSRGWSQWNSDENVRKHAEEAMR